MKLLLITAVAEFETEVKQILKKSNVKTYSYKEVTGYRNTQEEAIETNWFGTTMHENQSILFYVFTETENSDKVCQEIVQFNQKQETVSQIHFAILNIEKSN